MKALNSISICICLIMLVKVNAQTIDGNNGNMNIAYTDIVFKAKHPMNFSITRSYNSISTSKGIFGLGWTSNYETNILVVPGGGVAVYQWGNNLFLYEPREWDKQDIAIQVNKIIASAIKKVEVKSPEEISELKDLLMNNQEKRIKKFREYIIENPKEKLKIDAGRKLISSYGGDLFLETLSDGYKLENNYSRIQFFNLEGKLIKEEDKIGNFLLFTYDDKNQLQKISDNLGNYLTLNFKDNRVQAIDIKNIDGTEKKALYTYDIRANTLTSSTDMAGNLYIFEWDNEGGMTKIKYNDGREARITYDPVSYKCTSVQKKDGTKRTYEYPMKSADEYGNINTSYDSLGNQLKRVSHWYVYKTNDLGKRWKYKWQIIENKDTTFYVYNEKFNIPDSVFTNNSVYYTFTYTTKGQLKGIFKNGGVLVTVQVENEKLTKLKSAKHLYIPQYENDKISKLKTEDGTEIALPLINLADDPKGYKADIRSYIGVFKFTDLWYDISAQLY